MAVEGDDIVFDGSPYRVVKRLYKSFGSHKQTISDKPKDNSETRKNYYIVERKGRLFWVKEWLTEEWKHLSRYEHERLKRATKTSYKADGVCVRAVRAFGVSETQLLLEYLDGYRRLSDVKDRDKIVHAALGWLDKTGFRGDYDLSLNNIMVSGADVVLIDFESGLGGEKI